MLTSEEVAALFRVGPRTVTRWQRQGKLPGIRVAGTKKTLFPRAAVDALLSAAQAEPAA